MNHLVGSGDGVLKGLRVLVVDDGIIDRELTSAILSDAGACVLHGCDGSEGLALALGNPLDAIVLDIEMPHLSGLDVAARLRGMGVETPIYAVTSLVIAPEDPRRKKCNVSGWFRKPLDGAMLVRALSLPGQYAIRPQVHTESSERIIQEIPFDAERLIRATPRILAVVERFSVELPEIVAQIAAAFESHEIESLKSQLHRLRGASGSCGFSALMAAVERWENALDQEDGDDATRLVDLRRAAEDGRNAFRQFFDSRGEASLDA